MRPLLWFFDNKNELKEKGLTMEQLYDVVSLSRQGVHYHLNAIPRREQSVLTVCEIVQRVRKDEKLPSMGCREVYTFAKQKPDVYPIPKGIGRNKFEQIALASGFRIVIKKVFTRTTRKGAYYYKNLLEGSCINDINRIWVSDITYYEIYFNGQKVFFYITLILDIYSRRLLGAVASKDLTAESTVISALEAAYKTRGVKTKNELCNLIFHSDRGGQYIDKVFVKMLKNQGVKSSMAKEVYENTFAERINKTIKNDFLEYWKPDSFPQLVSMLKDAAESYNHRKPHQSIGGKTPVQFEEELKSLPLCQRTSLYVKPVEKNQQAGTGK